MRPNIFPEAICLLKRGGTESGQLYTIAVLIYRNVREEYIYICNDIVVFVRTFTIVYYYFMEGGKPYMYKGHP